MHRLTRRSVLALVVVGALIAGGAAYTSSIDGTGTTTNSAGYADVTVHGATLTDAVYGFSSDGSQVNKVTLSFSNDLTGKQVQVGLGPTGVDVAACTSTAGVDTDASGVVQAAAVTGGNTTVECDFGTAVDTGTATDLKVLVSNT